MARSTTLRLRGLWLQIHKWIGLILAVLIIPVSLTGSALVWHDWLDETLNPARHAVSGPPELSPSAYAAAAGQALGPGEQVMSIRYAEGEGPVQVVAARPPQPGEGRPVRTNVWLDPADGRVLDVAASNEGAVRFLHVLHGSLMIPGLGRQIVGWVGVAMLVSCLTGLWLWWPITGSWRRGLRWKRQNSTNANLHHQTGFWILLPLAMLSFTGAWISFPAFFGQFEASRPKGKSNGGGADRMRAMRARPLADPQTSPDRALELARPHATGPLVSIGWPTDQAPEWKVGFARERGAAEVEVADAGGEVTPPRPPRAETTARLMRRWHDGVGMGWLWQTIIFIGGIIPAVLAVTGIVMWLRSRGWRAKLKRKRRGRAEPVPQPAE
ncbi:PepSY domain-containing protein [Sphingosinicella sp. CPCC 101087]|uniref:PepSY-associated TM helix domain-containing protein n=1 Tax=Sphingosinicella sp. CPCC 101087 TaxID=2497754 RepID=UPI00101D7007|nr:PepSY-associated TM helix domain-containing protein [Sphingosinicella sp. CPCC 101087]